MTMVGDIYGFCCGCLSRDRKMKPVKGYWSDDLFLKIFSELQMDKMDAFSRHLCWECEARINNFAKFKTQVESCSTILHEYINKNHSVALQPFSKLTISNKELVHINIQNIKTDKITQNIGAGDSIIQLKHSGTQLDNSGKLLKNSNIQLKNSNMQLKNSDIQQDESEHQLKNSDTQQNNSVKQLKTSSKQLKNSGIQLNVADTKQEIKEEDYSDDDRSLIDIRNEEKIRKKRVKKEKKGKVRKKNKLVMFEEILLTKDEIFEERVTLTAKEDYINAMFKCEKCIIPYASRDDLMDHELAKHSLISKHTCEYCTRGFPSSGALAVHRRRHAARYRCGICRYRTANVSSATNHYNTTHTGSEIFDMAAKAFGTYNKIPENTEDSRPKSSAQIPCQYCEKTFRWKTSLRKHLETHRIEAGHKRRPYCEPCKMAFTTTSNLRKHVKTSSKHQIQLKLRKLKESPASEDVREGAQHIEDIKSSVNRQKEQYPCPQCEKKFQWKGNLWRHLRSHAAKANGELVCTPCNRTFSSIATYNQHMKISRKHVSEDEFKYMCSDCGKRFSNKTKLRDHVDWEHLKNYTHKCTTCQKVFKSHTSLYLHRQVVHRLYNAEHLCDHCGKSFPNKTKLRSHISALHTAESPYKCRWCGARFSWHSCLSRHARRLHRDKL